MKCLKEVMTMEWVKNDGKKQDEESEPEDLEKTKKKETVQNQLFDQDDFDDLQHEVNGLRLDIKEIIERVDKIESDDKINWKIQEEIADEILGDSWAETEKPSYAEEDEENDSDEPKEIDSRSFNFPRRDSDYK